MSRSPRTEMMLAPSIEECRALAVKEGMPEREGEKFFAHYTKVGWVCGKARLPMKSFAGAMLGWRLTWEEQGRPGAQVNGHPVKPGLSGADKMTKKDEYQRVIDELRSIRNTYSDNQSWRKADIDRWKELVAHRNKLRIELGIKV